MNMGKGSDGVNEFLRKKSQIWFESARRCVGKSGAGSW